VLPIKEEPTNDFMTPPDDLEILVENQEELIQVEETPKDFPMETLMLVKEFLGPKDML
jgi:hypothetical protein